MATKVVNKNRVKYDVDITRKGKWGTPFIIGVHGNRQEVIQLYREWIVTQQELMNAILSELYDKKLGCVCNPDDCHGDVLKELADKLYLEKFNGIWHI